MVKRSSDRRTSPAGGDLKKVVRSDRDYAPPLREQLRSLEMDELKPRPASKADVLGGLAIMMVGLVVVLAGRAVTADLTEVGALASGWIYWLIGVVLLAAGAGLMCKRSA